MCSEMEMDHTKASLPLFLLKAGVFIGHNQADHHVGQENQILWDPTRKKLHHCHHARHYSIQLKYVSKC